MTLTNLFFGLALGISLFFAVCFCALFILYCLSSLIKKKMQILHFIQKQLNLLAPYS